MKLAVEGVQALKFKLEAERTILKGMPIMYSYCGTVDSDIRSRNADVDMERRLGLHSTRYDVPACITLKQQYRACYRVGQD